MSPRGPRPDGPGAARPLAAAVTAQWRQVVDAVADLPDEAFATPSPLPGWTIADLVMHTARSATALSTALGAGPPAVRAGAAPWVTTTRYLTGAGARAEAIADAARGLAAGRDPAEIRSWLADEVSSAGAALDRLLAGADAVPGGPAPAFDSVVVTPGGPMRLADFLRTRAVEAVVHGLDLGVAPDRPALRVVTKVFADMFAELVPGRSVELRVPPFAAVQIVEGPRHTRGTPPNVVEADPVAFVLLVAGRVPWGQVVADGRVRASGERSDLSIHLPLL